MRRKNGQFISNAELTEIVEKLKSNHEQSIKIIDNYKKQYSEMLDAYRERGKVIDQFKEKMNVFSFILRMTEGFLVPLIAIPFIALFIVGDIESAMNVIIGMTKVYCLACFVSSIFITLFWYNEE